jgi:hypothetical protein
MGGQITAPMHRKRENSNCIKIWVLRHCTTETLWIQRAYGRTISKCNNVADRNGCSSTIFKITQTLKQSPHIKTGGVGLILIKIFNQQHGKSNLKSLESHQHHHELSASNTRLLTLHISATSGPKESVSSNPCSNTYQNKLQAYKAKIQIARPRSKHTYKGSALAQPTKVGRGTVRTKWLKHRRTQWVTASNITTGTNV